MPVRGFIDTNLWIYLFTTSNTPEDAKKKEGVISLLRKISEPVLSSQVLSEISNVLIKKMGFKPEAVQKRIYELTESAEILPLESTDIVFALDLIDRYSLSWFDSLVTATAIRSGVETIYTEDMQNGLLIDQSIRIVNPFL